MFKKINLSFFSILIIGTLMHMFGTLFSFHVTKISGEFYNTFIHSQEVTESSCLGCCSYFRAVAMNGIELLLPGRFSSILNKDLPVIWFLNEDSPFLPGPQQSLLPFFLMVIYILWPLHIPIYGHMILISGFPSRKQGDISPFPGTLKALKTRVQGKFSVDD